MPNYNCKKIKRKDYLQILLDAQSNEVENSNNSKSSMNLIEKRLTFEVSYNSKSFKTVYNVFIQLIATC